MKKITLTCLAVISAILLFAQPPQTFKYQAVARDNAGNVLDNQNVSFQISILQGSASGTIVFTETHDVFTNDFGLVNLKIGTGSQVIGTLDGINWASGPYYLQIEMDEAGGTNYQFMGTSQLLSVPYAQYAKHSSDATWNKNGFDLYYDDGKVGIGTINPITELDVNGNINSNNNYLIDGNSILSVEGLYNIMLGKGAGGNNIGAGCLFVGDSTGYNNQGYDNIFLGIKAGLSNTSGSSNVFVGPWAGFKNTIGDFNVYMGHLAGSSNTSGGWNSFLGYAAGSSNTGVQNTYVGCFSGLGNQAGRNNTFVGHNAGWENFNGVENTFLGASAGGNCVGDSNIFIGLGAGYFDTCSNKLIIANGPLDENTLLYGDFVSGNLGIGTKTLNHKLNINGNAVFKGEGGWDDPGDQANLFLGDPNHGLKASYSEGLRFWTYDDPSHDIRFQNHTGTDYMTIKMGTGHVGIGTNDPNRPLHINQNSSTMGIRLEYTSGISWSTYVDAAQDYNFAYNDALKSYIDDSDGSYITVSDRNLKTDINPFPLVLEKVKQLQPCLYRFKDDMSGGNKSIGLIAQEVEPLFPEVVHEKDGIKALNYDAFAIIAIQAIKEQQEMIEKQQSQIDELKEIVSKLVK